MRKITLFALGIFLLLSPDSFALERFEIFTTSEMVQLLQDRKDRQTDFLLVNALDEMIYRHASIPGSVNIPIAQVDKYAHRLGKDINKLIIPY